MLCVTGTGSDCRQHAPLPHTWVAASPWKRWRESAPMSTYVWDTSTPLRRPSASKRPDVFGAWMFAKSHCPPPSVGGEAYLLQNNSKRIVEEQTEKPRPPATQKTGHAAQGFLNSVAGRFWLSCVLFYKKIFYRLFVFVSISFPFFLFCFLLWMQQTFTSLISE